MTVNHNDPMSEQFYADLDHIMERITGIVGEVDATMTIGETVRLAYLQGIGDTLRGFSRLISQHSSIKPTVLGGIVDAESYGESMHELDAMTDRGGRIASMLAHPAWKEN